MAQIASFCLKKSQSFYRYGASVTKYMSYPVFDLQPLVFGNFSEVADTGLISWRSVANELSLSLALVCGWKRDRFCSVV